MAEFLRDTEECEKRCRKGMYTRQLAREKLPSLLHRSNIKLNIKNIAGMVEKRIDIRNCHNTACLPNNRLPLCRRHAAPIETQDTEGHGLRVNESELNIIYLF